MPHSLLIDAFLTLPQFDRLATGIPRPGSSLVVDGLAGSAPSLLVASLHRARPELLWVIVAPSPDLAEQSAADLEAILGEPPNDRRWFSRLYELRCRIAHGGITVARPGIVFDIGENEAVEAHLTEFFRPTDEAIAVLIAVMQDLVRSFAAGYEFAQAVARTPFRAPVV